MDLRSFIDELERAGGLIRVEGADWDLEIGAITELSAERDGSALLFDHIKGYPPGYRVITNVIDTPRRLALALDFPAAISHLELVRRIKDKFRELKPIPTALVQRGPLLENVYAEGEIDLLKFPTPKWHEYDGGRYLGTGDMVITKDPKDGWVNVGTYRIQLHDRDTLGFYVEASHHGALMRQSYWAQGKSCPVAVVFGAHPLVWMPSFITYPWGVEEYGFAGALLGQPLQVITGEYTGLPIPAYAEIAIEGDCLPPEVESRDEGPFGEWTGYYAGGIHREAVIKVKRVLHRADPIILGCPYLKPASGGIARYIIKSASHWHELERLGVPGITGVWNMRSGGSAYLNVISIQQKYAGHAKQVATAAMSGIGSLGRFVIIVDDDIDCTNDEDVMWAVATRCDPATDIEVITGCRASLLDPVIPPEQKARRELTNSRAIIMACRPYHWRKEFPRVNRASDELRSLTLKKWGQLFGTS